MNEPTTKVLATARPRLLAAVMAAGLYLLCASQGRAAAIAGVVPAARMTDWTEVGCPEPLPRPTLTANALDHGAKPDASAAAQAAIAAAIASLNGQPGVVLLPAGTYLLTAPISLPSGVILRGAGAGMTTLRCNPASSGSGCLQVAGKTSGSWRAVTAGYGKGSTELTLADTSGLAVGDWLELRQANGAWDTKPADWAAYAVGQMLRITALTATTVTVDRALRLDYDPALQPQVVRWQPVTDVGIESLTIDRYSDPTSGASYNILFSLAANSWVQDVEGNRSIGSHVMITRSSRITVRGCYFHHAYTYDGTGTRGYGVTISDHASDNLVEGNVFDYLRHAMMVKVGANGNVFAYNDSHNPNRSETFSDFAGDISLHGHYPFANLFEGNVVANIILDQYWGPNGPYNTFLRNRAEWYGILITPDSTLSNQQNVVGNEVTKGKSNVLLGLYYTLYYGLLGSGHFAHGNNVAGKVEPVGTTQLADVSYYRSGDFCQLAAGWPAIGLPGALGSGSNRARQRWVSASAKTWLPMWVDAGPAATVQDGQSVLLQGAAGGGQAPAHQSWAPQTGVSDPNSAQTLLAPTASGSWTLTRSDGNGCHVSSTAAVTVTGAVAAPVLSLPAGMHAGPVALSLSVTTAYADIWYTTDGTDPSNSPTALLYTEPISLAGAVTITAVALRPDFTPSPLVSASYDVDVDECALGLDSCAPVALCSNVWGSYQCTCNAGWTGSGWDCAPVCGDGMVVGSELCDDGPSAAASDEEDGCDSLCQPSAPGDRCADALVATPNEPLKIGWAGSHPSGGWAELAELVTSTCLAEAATPTADVFVTVAVTAGWRYSLALQQGVPAAPGEQMMQGVLVLLRNGCDQDVLACADETALHQPLHWEAQADGVVVLQLVRTAAALQDSSQIWISALPPVVQEPDADSGAETGTGTDAGAGAETGTGTDAGAETDAGTGTGTDAGTETDAETGTGTDAGAETDAETGTGTDAGTDAGAETDAGTGTGTDATVSLDSVGGTDAGTGTDAESGTDATVSLDSVGGTDADAETDAAAAVDEVGGTDTVEDLQFVDLGVADEGETAEGSDVSTVDVQADAGSDAAADDALDGGTDAQAADDAVPSDTPDDSPAQTDEDATGETAPDGVAATDVQDDATAGDVADAAGADAGQAEADGSTAGDSADASGAADALASADAAAAADTAAAVSRGAADGCRAGRQPQAAWPLLLLVAGLVALLRRRTGQVQV